MFKHTFKFQRRTEIIDGAKESDEVIISEYTPNGDTCLKCFRIRIVDIPEIIKILESMK